MCVCVLFAVRDPLTSGRAEEQRKFFLSLSKRENGEEDGGTDAPTPRTGEGKEDLKKERKNEE